MPVQHTATQTLTFFLQNHTHARAKAHLLVSYATQKKVLGFGYWLYHLMISAFPFRMFRVCSLFYLLSPQTKEKRKNNSVRFTHTWFVRIQRRRGEVVAMDTFSTTPRSCFTINKCTYLKYIYFCFTFYRAHTLIYVNMHTTPTTPHLVAGRCQHWSCAILYRLVHVLPHLQTPAELQEISSTLQSSLNTLCALLVG